MGLLWAAAGGTLFGLILAFWTITLRVNQTVVGAAILNAVVARVCEILMAEGITPPVFMSGNIDGGDEHNRRVMDERRDNIFYL